MKDSTVHVLLLSKPSKWEGRFVLQDLLKTFNAHFTSLQNLFSFTGHLSFIYDFDVVPGATRAPPSLQTYPTIQHPSSKAMRHDITLFQNQSHPNLHLCALPLLSPSSSPLPSWPHSYCHRQNTLKWSWCLCRFMRSQNLTGHLLAKEGDHAVPVSVNVYAWWRGWGEGDKDREQYEGMTERKWKTERTGLHCSDLF